jgi:hypothetical protein
VYAEADEPRLCAYSGCESRRYPLLEILDGYDNYDSEQFDWFLNHKFGIRG